MTNEAWHKDVLSEFHASYFANTLNEGHLKEEIAVKNGDDEVPFWHLVSGKINYLLPAELVNVDEVLPIKVFDTVDLVHRGKVFKRISDYGSIKFQSEKKMDFRTLIDTIAPFEHTAPDVWTLMKIIAVTSYITRLNVRISTNAGFGKDSIVNILRELRSDVSVITPRSMAAIEYRLFNPNIILNETSDITEAERGFIQSFLLRCGDLSNTYEKSTRGSREYGTQDTYDISDLSLLIYYKTLDYYQKTGHEKRFFDKMFTPAVCDRFLPLTFTGVLDVLQFDVPDDLVSTVEFCRDTYIDTIHSIEWFKQNGFEVDTTVREIPESVTGRHKEMWVRIVRSIRQYANDEEEAEYFENLLLNAYLDYDAMLHGRSISNYTTTPTEQTIMFEDVSLTSSIRKLAIQLGKKVKKHSTEDLWLIDGGWVPSEKLKKDLEEMLKVETQEVKE